MNREADAYLGFISRSLERIVATLDGLDGDALAWRPPAEDANSLAAIVAHAMSNAEENVLGTLCGEEIWRERAGEFAAGATADELRERWTALHERLSAAMGRLRAADLSRERHHPRRGALTGREVLIVAARHAAEHQGEAELTRHLLDAALAGPRRAP
jgi:hypothetical protein